MIRLRCAVWGVIALGLLAGAASCQSAPAVSNEELLQAVEELRAKVAVLERIVARLEQERDAAKAPPVPVSAPASASAPPVKAAKAQ